MALLRSTEYSLHILTLSQLLTPYIFLLAFTAPAEFNLALR